MCQEIVDQFLKDNQDDWFTAREIAEGCGISLNSAVNNCYDMRKAPTRVQFKIVDRSIKGVNRKVILYKYKPVKKILGD